MQKQLSGFLKSFLGLLKLFFQSYCLLCFPDIFSLKNISYTDTKVHIKEHDSDQKDRWVSHMQQQNEVNDRKNWNGRLRISLKSEQGNSNHTEYYVSYGELFCHLKMWTSRQNLEWWNSSTQEPQTSLELYAVLSSKMKRFTAQKFLALQCLSKGRLKQNCPAAEWTFKYMTLPRVRIIEIPLERTFLDQQNIMDNITKILLVGKN